MCLKCDGYSDEEIHNSEQTMVDIYGWFYMAVGEPERVSRGYTVGLMESFDHPELLCFGLCPDGTASVVTGLAEAVADFQRIDDEALELLDVELVPIHPDHLDTPLMQSWANRYGRYPLAGEAFQILPGPQWDSHLTDGIVPRLDNPDSPRPR